jgi:hypothetical protein
MRAAGLLAEAGVLREYLQNRQVKYLVWGYYETDGMQRISSELAQGLKGYLDPGFSQGLVEHREAIDAEVRQFAEAYLDTQRQKKWYENTFHALTLKRVRRGLAIRANSLSRGVPFVQPKYRHEATQFGVELPDDIGVFIQVTETILSEARRLNARPIFLYIPSIEGMQERAAGGQSPSALLKSRITSHITSLGIDIVDIDARFRTLPDFLSVYPFRLGGHFTVEGYQIIGEAILEKISEIESRSTFSDLPAERARFVAGGGPGK